ncbi:GNAT family N-acetyltransferase [Burkholderia sp. HI4860]|uniref:GNAT family N-acetyltransferase n=2 Tax=Burkholderiaceae TaxID=119060 RepID=UPI003241FBD8
MSRMASSPGTSISLLPNSSAMTSGHGLARKLIAMLELRAVDSGCTVIRLETGPYQHEALALYASAGYQRRGPFGDYTDDPLSVFMQKHIAS